MNIDLSGKTAVVSGSTAGIGFAIASGLAAAGAHVVINGRTAAAVERAVEAIADSGAVAPPRGVVADLATADGCAALLAQAPEADILVNNLGIYGAHDFFALADEEWARFFDTNVMSGVRLSRHYLSGMVKRGWGRVVFLSSESALNIPANMIHYGVTKTAYLALSRGLAKRVAGSGVTVNAVLPGPTMSEGLKGALAGMAEKAHETLEEAGVDFVRHHRPSSILRRPTSPEEVANMVVYVCSSQASGTTGAALRVDGGVVDTIA